MGRILELLVFATILTVCSADCQVNSNRPSYYFGCTDLQFGTQLPEGAVGIEISSSNIEKLSTDMFSLYGNSLEELNITGCRVEKIEPNAFRGLEKLRILGLASNNIRKLDASWLQDLPNLEVLIVWNNQITEIDERIYNFLPKLEIWDIANNNLTNCLPPELLKKLTRLSKIYLSGNPWSYRCRPAMTWFLDTNHVRAIHDWGTNDLLIEECLAHKSGANVVDVILEDCVNRKIVSVDEIETLKTNFTMLENRLRNYYG